MSMPRSQVATTGKTRLAERALDVLREALQEQKLCDPALDVDSVLQEAQSHPEESLVDSFAAATILASLDEIYGTALPREILNHRSLTTLSGLKRSLGVLEKLGTSKK